MTLKLTLMFFATIAALPAPQHVTMNSLNMGAVLDWSPASNSSSNTTYTAEYRPAYRDEYEAAEHCRNIKELSCDFSKLLRHLGIYTFRVRAELHGETSQWVEYGDQWMPDRETVIGPPAVHLVYEDGAMKVLIQDPVLKIRSLREVYHNVVYIIRYWREGYEEESEERSVEESNVKLKLKLGYLEPGSCYCVQARVFIQNYNKKGQFSSAVCAPGPANSSNTPPTQQAPVLVGPPPTQQAPVLVGCLVAITVVLPLLILASWFSYRGQRFLYPKAKLPEHFKQYLMEAPRLSVPPAMQNTLQSKEKYDTITAVSQYDEISGVLYEALDDDISGVFEGSSKYYNVAVQCLKRSETQLAIQITAR